MSLNHSPRIVTDGMILNLDIPNQKSYSPNAFPLPNDIATWYINLKGNNLGNYSNNYKDTTVISPVGSSPMRMDITGNDPHIGSYNALKWNLAPAAAGQTWTVSVYAKASANLSSAEIYIFGANSSGSASNGAGGWYDITSKSFNLTTEWARFEHKITLANANTAYLQMRLDGPQNNASGYSVWWDGLQVEQADAASTFNPSNYSTSGKQIMDLSGQGNHGTLYTTNTMPQSNSGGYLTFPQFNRSGITIANNEPIYFLNTDPCTFELWYKINTIPPNTSTWSRVFHRESNNGSGRDGYNLWLNGVANGTHVGVYSERFVAGTASYVGVNLPFTGTGDQWNHWVITYDGTSRHMYRNGTLVSGPTSDTRNVTNNVAPLTIMNGSVGTPYSPGGELANFKVYNRALSSAEVLQNFNAHRGRYGL